jgi:hypothetical protein
MIPGLFMRVSNSADADASSGSHVNVGEGCGIQTGAGPILIDRSHWRSR